MKKKKLVFLAFATIAIALLLEAGILKYVNDSNTYRMSKVLLDRVITVLNKNDDSENGLIESLKDDYIAVSYTHLAVGADSHVRPPDSGSGSDNVVHISFSKVATGIFPE